jgi:hypothetical protein
VRNQQDAAKVDFSQIRSALKQRVSDREEKKMRKEFEEKLAKVIADIETITPNMKVRLYAETLGYCQFYTTCRSPILFSPFVDRQAKLSRRLRNVSRRVTRTTSKRKRMLPRLPKPSSALSPSDRNVSTKLLATLTKPSRRSTRI